MKKFGRNFKSGWLKLRPTQNQRGAVTAETAIGITSLSTFLVIAIFMVSYVSNQLTVTDATRTAARLVARGESPATVEYAVDILAPGSKVSISYGIQTAKVEVIGPENPKIIWYLPRIRSSVHTYLENGW
jgi:Flp pilus assembly protein TadG